MSARRGGVSIDVVHEHVDDAMPFQVRIASLIPGVDQSGTDITHTETVTLMDVGGRACNRRILEAPRRSQRPRPSVWSPGSWSGGAPLHRVVLAR
jgi:hypothetical protein